ncbi:hypothetical protein [Flavobacterium psychrophilum]|uniref:hypothetical protein n=1 Tax=Flavobacterium psychrophilum TaxID=96345 RepID=UPI000B7C3C06|nr:hypothetical protein [Flavobacterium psychrophilum]ELI6454945.1 hypothetical protein [Flavobacterium psychrophilum]SNB39486.1 conserved hypothetical protein [Flavobacterium psychrophilum]
MKLLFSIFCILISFNNLEVSEIRRLYPNAANSEITSKEFASKLSDITSESNKTLVAYKGASITIFSKFEKKISNKVKTFKEGAKLVEFAIASDPNNIEIRLIRLSIQENTPKIVKYNKNTKEDVAFILAHYKEQTNATKEYIKSFVKQSKSFSSDEKLTIK